MRLNRLETFWEYYLGFGLPMAILMWFLQNTPILAAGIVATLFPILIVVAVDIDSAKDKLVAVGGDFLIPKLPIFWIAKLLNLQLLKFLT